MRSMKFIDIPYLAESLFAMSVLIFIVTLYLVLPGFISKKKLNQMQIISQTERKMI